MKKQFIELKKVPDLKVLRLPNGITEEHIQGMIKKGILLPENVKVDNFESMKIDAKVPQAFGNTQTGIVQYVMNHKGLEVFAKYLGGRLPTMEELRSIWDRIPGENVREKCDNAGIPFTGCFGAVGREFCNVGEWTYLMSSSERSSGFEGLDLGRDGRLAEEGWGNSGHGFSVLVVFG